MTECKIRIGDAEMTADIDDPTKAHWTATIPHDRGVGRGVAAVLIIGAEEDDNLYSEADVLPAGLDEPTRLRGKLPFHK